AVADDLFLVGRDDRQEPLLGLQTADGPDDAEHLVADRLVGLAVGGDLERERQHRGVAPLAERAGGAHRLFFLTWTWAAGDLAFEVLHRRRSAQGAERLGEEVRVLPLLGLGLDLGRPGDERRGAAIARPLLADLAQQ